ncbi:MAG: tetratricopeptide repeat protein [Nitrospirae bacterium]|nr:tetratricopeptide repeat protein [Nitrospirota bacterium]
MTDRSRGHEHPAVHPQVAHSMMAGSALGRPSAKAFQFALALLAAVLLWSGCASPRAPSARLPSYSDPNVEAQARLLQHARAYHTQGRYEQAAKLLRNFIHTYPRSPFLTDSRWWLARVYERTGDLKAALAQYRMVEQAATEATTLRQVRSRIAELETLLGASSLKSNGLTGLMIPSHRLPAVPDLEEWLRTLARAGVTTLVLDAWTRHGVTPAGVYFRTDRAPVNWDILGRLVPLAHQHGLAVFAAVTLRRMNWLEPPLQWNDSAYDPSSRQLRPTPYLDIFNPAFQDHLISLLTDLAASGVDGMLFRSDAPLGPTEGFSAFGLQGFERDFHIQLDPLRLSWLPEQEDPASRSPKALTAPKPLPESAPEFWRWSGWKARETLKVMDRLRRALRGASPKLQFALEIHPEAVTDPVEALVRYGEDLLEAKRGRFDCYVAGSGLSNTPSVPGSLGQARENGPAIAARMLELLGEPERIWVEVPLPAGDLERVGERLNPASDQAAMTKGIGLIYLGNSVSLP